METTVTEYVISTKVLIRSMSTIARYASGTSFAKSGSSNTAKHAASEATDTFKQWAKSRNHLLIQVGIFAIIVGSIGAHLSIQNSQDKSAILASASSSSEAYVAVDKLSSTEVAAVVALTTDSLVADEVLATAESVDASNSVTVSSKSYVSKPSAALTDDKSAVGIIRHEVAKGESLSEIAKQYGVSVDTIMWANGLDNKDVSKGDTIKIPPVDGVVYTVKAGDSAKEIANKFGANADRIVAFNDAELTGFKKGQRIVIPGGEKEVNSTAAVASSPTERVYAAAGIVNSSVQAAGPDNGYARGYCTWGVANLVGIPRMWGNANRWDDSARASGFTVNRTPQVGAVAQTDAGWGGHVGLVIGVKGNKIIMKDMNGPAGFGVYGIGTYSASNYNYIHL